MDLQLLRRAAINCSVVSRKPSDSSRAVPGRCAGLRPSNLGRTALLLAIVVVAAWLPRSARADVVVGENAARNEATKTEVYYYYEYKAASAGLAKIETKHSVSRYNPNSQGIETYQVVVPMASAQASAGQWLTGPVRKMGEDLAINRIYHSGAVVGTNVERYKIHYIVPDGFQLYYRPLGTQEPFKAASVLESTTFNVSAYETVVMKTVEQGALPGKATSIDSGEGEMRISLGLLPNGQSAGFLDFKHDLTYLPAADDGLTPIYGRPLGAGDLRTVSLSNEVEVIPQAVPAFQDRALYQSAVSGVRQVIAPQAIVDVSKEGYDLLIKFYTPSAAGSRITSEPNPYATGTINYDGGSGPYALSGSPFVTYRVAWTTSTDNGGDFSNEGYDSSAITTINVTRTEGEADLISSVTLRDFYATIPPSDDWFPCDECGGSGVEPGTCYSCFGSGVEDCSSCDGAGSHECDVCSGEGEVDTECYECTGSGDLPCPDCTNNSCTWCETCSNSGRVGCSTCGNDGVQRIECLWCRGMSSFTCTWCGGSGAEACFTCSGSGTIDEDCMTCGGGGEVLETVPGRLDSSYASIRVMSVDSFGSKFSSTTRTFFSGRPFPEGDLPSGWSYGLGISRDTVIETVSSATRSKRSYEGAFPKFDWNVALSLSGSTASFDFLYTTATQKLVSVEEGDNGLLSTFGYYRYPRSDGKHATHHGRTKWQHNADGSWQAFDYSTNLSTLGRVTKIVGPYKDTALQQDVPSGDSAAGLRITSYTYAQNWEGVHSLTDTVTETANDVQVGYTDNDYSSTTANGQPVWITTTTNYAASSVGLTSITKIYQGTNVASWLRGLLYSSQRPDQSKETMAYHRGTYDAQTKTFSKGSGGAFRSVLLKGTAQSNTAWTEMTSYDGTEVDTIYLVPHLSTAEVTIRDERAMTVRTETQIYTGTGWALIDSSDMEYDLAGNLTKRSTLNGGLYEAGYVNGRKGWERDELGVRTEFPTYDAKGRLATSVRKAISGAPEITTTYTYDDENRLLSTAAAGSDTFVSSKAYNRAGQVTSETSQGQTTSFAYTIANGKVTRTDITLPGGGTRIVEKHLDGREKSITGTAALEQYFDYGFDGGRETVQTYLASLGSARWSKSFSDWLGRTVRQESSTSAGTVVQASEYNSYGQLSRTQTDNLAPTLYVYDGLGVMTRSGLDLNSNGTLDSTDRITGSAYGFFKNGSTWWSYAESLAFPDGETVGKVVSRTETRLNDFSGVTAQSGVSGSAIAEVIVKDAHGNASTARSYRDRSSATVTTVAFSPFATQPAIAVSVANRVTSQTSPAGVQVSTVYDGSDRPIKTIDRTSIGYSGNNIEYYAGTTRVRSMTDNRGVRQHYYEYDDAGRVIKDETPRISPSTGGTIGYNASHFAYDTRGQLTHIWGDVPYPVKYVYNAYGDRTEQYTYRDGTAAWTQANLPASGWPTTGDKTELVPYAADGRLYKRIDAAAKEVTYAYNRRGQLTQRTWSRGLAATYSYYEAAGEATGALKKVDYSDAATPDVDYTYDRMGRIKTIKDGTGDRTFTYRSVDQKPDSELFGRLGATTTNHLLGTTRQLTHRYHSTTGRFEGMDLTQSGTTEYTIAYNFNATNGRLGGVTTAAGTFAYGYQTNSNLITSITRGSYTQSRTFEANRNALDTLGVATQAGTIAAYDYASDDLGRRTSVEQSGLIYASYLAVSEIMRTVYEYNERNEVTSSISSVASTALAGRNFGYEFDPIGNRTKEKFDGVAHTYTPDARNRYTARATPSYLPVSGIANRSGGAAVSVDGTPLATGNWKNNYFFKSVAKTQPSQASYQSVLIQATGSDGKNWQGETTFSAARPINETFDYDDDGNLTGDALWVYTYDGENRLTAVHAKLADQTGRKFALHFTYDYLGRRVSKDVLYYEGVPTSPTIVGRRAKSYFLYQGWTMLAEYDGALSDGAISGLRRRYTYGVDLSGGDGSGGLLAIEEFRAGFTGTYLSVYDGNGNLTALVNGADGKVAAAYEYDPFGNVLRASGNYGRENPLRFAGKYFDSETGLSYYGFRYYSASLGRFINRDPIGEAGGLNIYGFADNDGINGGDLYGLASWAGFKDGVKSAWGSFTGALSSGWGRVSGGMRTGWQSTTTAVRRITSAIGVTKPAPAQTPTSGDVVTLPEMRVEASKGPNRGRGIDLSTPADRSYAREVAMAAGSGGDSYWTGQYWSDVGNYFGRYMIGVAESPWTLLKAVGRGYAEIGGLVAEGMTGQFWSDVSTMIINPGATASATIGVGADMVTGTLTSFADGRNLGNFVGGAALGSVALPGSLGTLSNASKGAIGEATSLVTNVARGNIPIGRQVPLQVGGRFPVIDWQFRNAFTGSVRLVESKFGTGRLTSAQRAAAPLLTVEKWTYPFWSKVGAAGGAVGSGGNP